MKGLLVCIGLFNVSILENVIAQSRKGNAFLGALATLHDFFRTVRTE